MQVMLPKLVCRLEPALVLRKVLVRSMNATGVMVASPIFICKGEVSATACAAGAGAAAGVNGTGVGASAGRTIGAWRQLLPIALQAGVRAGAGSAGAARGIAHRFNLLFLPQQD